MKYRKYLLVAAALVVIGATSIKPAMAYFTDSHQASGTVTVYLGDMEITPDEKAYDWTKEITVENTGDYDVFVHTRVRLQEQRRELQKKLKYASSSHGRVKKLRKLDILRKREANFAKTMNHKMSSDIVKFAVKNEAKYINMQDLTSFGKDNRDNIKSGYEFALRNWSYFQLQQMVTYKAATYGIIVRKISNDNLSDTCSICGAEGIIEDGAFICSDPNCLSHDKYEKARKNGKGNYFFNSDFNISRNASISENFTTKKRKSKAEKKEERKAKKEKENLDKT
jgi:IS605 OrfB family transposase